MSFTQKFLALIIFQINLISITPQDLTLIPSNTLYYPEKYFRFLANNYDSIAQGDFWTTFPIEKGIGFEANEDFGSFLFVKDWSMYSFKLRKIVFRPFCSYNLTSSSSSDNFCDAEMLLYHSIDNNYYPPGRRVYLDINYLVISVPFKISSLMNPANDKIFSFLQLDMFKDVIKQRASYNENFPRICPFKPVKLYQIIQHQPSYLFENELIPGSGTRSLYLVFAKFHYISEFDYNNLNIIYSELFGNNTVFDSSTLHLKIATTLEGISDSNIYRNWENPNELEPTATLMAYNRGFYIHFSAVLLFITIAVLI